ncbi:MAG: hypothetical protein U0694_02665 [Anaerolineae bacterium]
MASSTQVSGIQRRIAGYPAASYRFDLLVAVLCVFFLCGLFLDGWAHNSGRVDNSFFTPWHAVLYSSYGLVGLTLVGTQFANTLKGHAWTRALPRGYGLGLVGVLLFGFGGGFDFVWHDLFGFEADIQALLSPAHLLLATGACCCHRRFHVPVDAQRQTRRWKPLLPALISICVFIVMTFFMQYSHYLGSPAHSPPIPVSGATRTCSTST